MNAEQNQTINFGCHDCGSGHQLIINNVRQGFFETGWRADYSRRNRPPSFVCAGCLTNLNISSLREQQRYLEHIFEAQQRFGE